MATAESTTALPLRRTRFPTATIRGTAESDDYDDNHIALQDCGAGLANSPAHYTANLSRRVPFVPTELPG